MSFEQQLEKYAEVAIKIGINLQEGQTLLIGADLEHAEFARALTRQAYRAGAKNVEILWSDPISAKIRLEEAPEDSLEIVPQYLIDYRIAEAETGSAFIRIAGDDPNLMADIDPARMKKRQMAARKASVRISELGGRNAYNWLVVQAAHPVQAAKMFPDMPLDEAMDKLWKTIFTMCRADVDDPVAAWDAHAKNLRARKNYLNEKQYTSLHYRAEGTDLRIGLPKGHYWEGAGSYTENGEIFFIPNIPTEEVFTLAHRDQIDGIVTSTKPLVYNGTLIEQFKLQFSEGSVVHAEATTGQHALDNLLSTDEGARSLGEIALVPHSSPISQSGLIFYSTLYDENASSHLALGRAYRFSLNGGTEMDDEEFAEKGGNLSLTHVDFMIGSGGLDIDGINADGGTEPVMRAGEWAFDV